MNPNLFTFFIENPRRKLEIKATKNRNLSMEDLMKIFKSSTLGISLGVGLLDREMSTC